MSSLPDQDSTKPDSLPKCPACGRSNCVVFRNVAPVNPDDVFDVDYRSLRAITGELDSRHRIAVRNTATNRLSYIDAVVLTRHARRNEQRLRNAASSLLATLKRIYEYECSCCAGDCGCGFLFAQWAKDAIAKAEGR